MRIREVGAFMHERNSFPWQLILRYNIYNHRMEYIA